MNWHIGQRIVAVVNHSQGLFKKDDEFIIYGIRDSFCKCNDIDLDIGFKATRPTGICNLCKTKWKQDYIWWVSATLFVPLDDLSNHTADSLMEEMDKEVSVKETHKELAHIKHSQYEKDIMHNLWSCRCSLRPYSNHPATYGTDNGAD